MQALEKIEGQARKMRDPFLPTVLHPVKKIK